MQACKGEWSIAGALAFPSSRLDAVNCPKTMMAGWVNATRPLAPVAQRACMRFSERMQALTPTTGYGSEPMAEATESVRLIRLRASIGIAINVRARQVALNATKDQLRRQGLRISSFRARDLRLKAEAYLSVHREELVAEARATVEQWRRNFFGKRCAALSLSRKGFCCADVMHETGAVEGRETSAH
jgi:hypothetical protein